MKGRILQEAGKVFNPDPGCGIEVVIGEAEKQILKCRVYYKQKKKDKKRCQHKICSQVVLLACLLQRSLTSKHGYAGRYFCRPAKR